MWPVALGILSYIAICGYPLRGDVALVSEFVGYLGTVVFLRVVKCLSWKASLSSALLYILIHLLSICVSAVAYRISPWHPLAKFAGPLLPRCTSLWHAFKIQAGCRYRTIAELHDKYGTVVRIGPNTLSINAFEAINFLYSRAEAPDKSKNYVPGRIPGDGLFFMTNREKHNDRRRLWATGFSPHSLLHYQDIIVKYCDILTEKISADSSRNQSVNFTAWLQYWSYDVMGCITFGSSSGLDLMTDHDPNRYVQSGQQGTAVFEMLGEVPSLFDIMSYLPVTKELHVLEDIARQFTVLRKADLNAPPTDLASHLLGLHSESGEAILSNEDLNLDALFAIQAGSDTTSSVLSLLFYYLVKNPVVYKKLQAELDHNFPGKENAVLDVPRLAELEYLDGVVQEGVRLGTPISGLPRLVPPGGMEVRGQHVPQGTIVSIPAWAQQINVENFSPDPLAFNPERWFPRNRDKYLTRKASVLAFSHGPFGCLGKSLAILELRVVVARICLSFDLHFPSDFDHDEFRGGICNMRTTILKHPLRLIADIRR